MIQVHQLRTKHWLRLVGQIDAAAGCCPPRKKWMADAMAEGLEEAWRRFKANPDVHNQTAEFLDPIEVTMEEIRRDHAERFPER